VTDATRSYPDRPVLAVSVAVFRDGKVLLAARGREPMKGVFTLPGGAVEAGERLEDAARREVLEETGLGIGAVRFVSHEELIRLDDDDRAKAHFVICVFSAAWSGGEPTITEEATEFRWADPATLDDLPVTPGLFGIVALAKAVQSA
jgi:ADP-ribose pyrophosphatase YjhB (NUDIX family)